MTPAERNLVERAKADIDAAGSKLPKHEWIELCEEVASYFEIAADAAREELRAEEDGDE